MQPVNLGTIARVAEALDALEERVVFTGGSVIPLLVDNEALLDIRPTKDVDVIVEVLTLGQHQALVERLPALGFTVDTSKGAPRCRWLLDDVMVDIMSAHPIPGELNARWFGHAVDHAVAHKIEGTTLRVVGAPSFIATKIEAFTDRGKRDFLMSHDFEDVITLLDNRATMVEEITQASADLRKYIAEAMQDYLEDPECMNRLAGHLPSDQASQERLPELTAIMKALAECYE